MLHDSIDALLNRDTAKAQAVLDSDDEVDDLYDQVYRELLLFMIQDPHTIERATYLLWVAHDIERIADRATNIAEQVLFLVKVDGRGTLTSPAVPLRRLHRGARGLLPSLALRPGDHCLNQDEWMQEGLGISILKSGKS